MPLSRNNEERLSLPEVVHPPDSLCFQVSVPNDRGYLAAFFGAIGQLGQWRTWALDDAHTAKEVAAVWRAIYFGLDSQRCDIPPTPSGLSSDEDCEMCCLRFQDGFFQQFSCGVWTNIPGQPVGGFSPTGQPGAGQPQPTPGGGEACYLASTGAMSAWLLPTGVNTGDVIQATAFTGSNNDGTDAVWWLPNGNQMFLGVDTGYSTNVSTDPLPTNKHMELVCVIAGVFYPIGETGILTVPVGVVNEQVTFQLNTDNLSICQGSYGFNVCVTNNSAGTFSHHFDFRLSQFGWKIGNRSSFAVPFGGTTWIGGQGFKSVSTLAGGGILEAWLEGVNISDYVVRMVGSNTNPNAVNGIYTTPNNSYPNGTPTSRALDGTQSPGFDLSYTFGGGLGMLDLMLNLVATHSAETLFLTDCYITGPGTDPF